MPQVQPQQQEQLFTMQPSGLLVQGEPTFEQWEQYGQRLFTIITASQWALGDWLNYGEARPDWGETWTQALTGTQKSEDSMLSAMNVCKKFPPERRRLELSFAHHREVAALENVDQERWLVAAIDNRWTVKELREHIKAERLLAAPPLAVTDDGGEVHEAEDRDWTRDVSTYLGVFRHIESGEFAVLSSLTFRGPEDALPSAWRRLLRRSQRDRESLELRGYRLIEAFSSWRAPSQRVTALVLDPQSIDTPIRQALADEASMQDEG